MVSIVGRPNVGKSTLLNKLVGEKVAIVSKVPQTTRNQIRGVYTDERGQIVFIDTPGLHVGRDKLDQFMNDSAQSGAEGADCIIYLVDTMDRLGVEEEDIASRLARLDIPIVLGLNKVDQNAKHLDEYIKLWERAKGMPVSEMKNVTILPLSGKTGVHIDTLYEILFGYLPEGPALYPPETVCDIPQKMVMADIIREKLFLILQQELPHAIGVVVEDARRVKGKTLRLEVTIWVVRDSQKAIVIGKGGANLKQVGSLARAELEELLETKVFLDIFVKVKKDWRDNDTVLSEMGYELME
ncbi:MAG TPA: GTPase Era [Candidatus Bathyarchaeia archaeon]|nr:GTPase Era [Candidatus Bathyarchaeia archaeon]